MKPNSLERPNVGLAPMDGVSDLAVRTWFRLIGGSAFYNTPFLRVTRDFPARRIPRDFCPDFGLEVPAIPQLMSSDPVDFIRIAEALLHKRSHVDLNCGCPSPKVVGHAAGSSLLRDPAVFHRFVSKLVAELGPRKVSVKIRTGFHDDKNFDQLIDALDGLAIRYLTIHGRTRAEGYGGKADWGKIERAAERLQVPVVGSGDLFTPADRERARIECPHVEAWIAGRGALMDPFLFYRLETGLEGPQWRLIPLMMQCLLGLFRLQRENYHLVMEIAERADHSPAGASEPSWRAYTQQICGSDQVQLLPVSPGSLARFKMIWCFWRRSLGPQFMTRDFLRSQNWNEFISLFRSRVDHLPRSPIGMTLSRTINSPSTQP